MKKILLILFLSLILNGCDKLKGDKGDKGDAGTPGEDATATTYDGFISSDQYVVSINELNYDEMPIVVVYVSDGSGEWIEIPCYSFYIENNIFSIISKGKVTIYNGYSGGMREYYIIVAAYPHAPMYKRLF